MDRRVLSDAAVVAASRDLVCARLATYESAEEGRFLASICRTRSGQLENTVFTVLAPDGTTTLVPAGRGPEHVFGGSPEDAPRTVAEALKGFAAKYPAKPGARELPYLADLRRGLNVAACDLLPLAVVVAPTPEARRRVEAALAPLAWSAPYVGRLEYASAEQLKAIDGAAVREGLVVVEPDAYGLKGRVLAETPSASEADLRKTLDAALKAFAPKTKDSRTHIREGERAGVHWETVIPVTDPGGPPRR